jgi:hypothetical protein
MDVSLADVVGLPACVDEIGLVRVGAGEDARGTDGCLALLPQMASAETAMSVAAMAPSAVRRHILFAGKDI